MSQKLEEELKALLIDALMLEDVAVGDIDSETALFGSGLGLDSIDALELAMAIDKQYGVRIKADDEENKAIFENIKSLTDFVARNLPQ
ncbi:MAG: phosphopantetheine-binding protein [Sandaracinaceae bacterium]